jgi:hypothetical protein
VRQLAVFRTRMLNLRAMVATVAQLWVVTAARADTAVIRAALVVEDTIKLRSHRRVVRRWICV